MSRQTITGDLRKWHLQQPKGMPRGAVTGYMYNDVDEIWDDGEYATIHFILWYETSTFYLCISQTGRCYRLAKDEEKPDAASNRGVD
jgi:hypothetical protein